MGLMAANISRLALGHVDPFGIVISLPPSPPNSDPSAACAIALAISARSYMGLSDTRPVVSGAVSGVARLVVIDGSTEAGVAEMGGTRKVPEAGGGMDKGDKGSGLC